MGRNFAPLIVSQLIAASPSKALRIFQAHFRRINDAMAILLVISPEVLLVINFVVAWVKISMSLTLHIVRRKMKKETRAYIPSCH